MKLRCWCFCLWLFVMAGLASSLRAESPPNVLVIVADDLGYADMSFLPQSPADVHTPGIDRLAGEGTYFSNAYSTSPICSPSRAGLITGRYQQRWGNYWYGQGGLPSSELALPQALKPLGYASTKIGKTHLNGGEAEHPLDHGFDHFLGFRHHTWDYIRLSDKDLQAYRDRANGKSLGILNVGPLERDRGERASYEDGFTTKIFTDEAEKIIKASAEDERPFYIQLEHNAVHMPTYIADPDYANKAGYQQPVWDRDAERWAFPFWDPNESSWEDWHKKWGHLGEVDPLGRKRYLANLMALDDSVTSLLDTLEKTNQREKTVIVFLSDNGGTINTYSNNDPLRGYKYMFGEGGVRIPLIVSWPGRLPEGESRQAIASGMDVFPTIVELAGGDVPSNLDGRSLVGGLRTSTPDSGHDHLCFTDGKETWSIRQGDWKLISSPGWTHLQYKLDHENIAHRAPDEVYPEGVRLFNLRDDRGELNDLSAAFPQRVEEMSGLYETWRAKMGEPVSGKKKRAGK
ncbi:MAG: sulfatase family protein [Rubripirellula sp.]